MSNKHLLKADKVRCKATEKLTEKGIESDVKRAEKGREGVKSEGKKDRQ
jgi:hypothetical protein